MLKISILSIGDELCIGQVLNTNARFMAVECTKIGADVVLHSTIDDDKSMMTAELDRLTDLSELILITGGLGPTHDDITKPVLCEYFNSELKFHESTYKDLEYFFSKRGIELTERNKLQAMLPDKCTPLRNMVGTAPGMMFERNGKFFISMPGVPREMQYIMNNSVLPFIAELIDKRNKDVVLYRTIHTNGIPESMLADKLGNPDEFASGAKLAFLPSYRGVRLRIGVNAKTFGKARSRIDEIESYINLKVGEHVFGTDDESLETAAAELLIKYGKTVSVAESCTGGLLGAAFTNVSGSSSYFEGGVQVYSNQAKMTMLGVSPETINVHGAVSEQTAKELAENVRKKFGTDYALSVTGIAGRRAELLISL